MKDKFDVVVIGLGAGGACVLREILEKNKPLKILCIEGGEKIIPQNSTTNHQCFKCHSGVHYAKDKPTAEKCLERSLAFARKWEDCLLGEKHSKQRYNRHFIMSNSLASPEEVNDVVKTLQNNYKNCVGENPNNWVFGHPEKFIRPLKPEEYNKEIAKNIPCALPNGEPENAHVQLAFEVGEPQIDVNKMRTKLEEIVKKSDNVTVKFKHYVTDIKPIQDDVGYIVTAKCMDENGKEKAVKFETTAIINSCWQNIENLERSAGVYSPPEESDVCIRLKGSLLVELPDELKNYPTCIFSIGPYVSFTNLGNKTAILTFEPVTNIGFYIEGNEPTEEIKSFQKNGNNMNSQEGKEIAEGILNGCSKFIPMLSKSKPIETRIGYVKMVVPKNKSYSNSSIYEKDSIIHTREEDGLTLKHTTSTFISVAATKFIFAQYNAEQAYKILTEGLKNAEEWKDKYTAFQVDHPNISFKDFKNSIDLMKKSFGVLDKTNLNSICIMEQIFLSPLYGEQFLKKVLFEYMSTCMPLFNCSCKNIDVNGNQKTSNTADLFSENNKFTQTNTIELTSKFTKEEITLKSKTYYKSNRYDGGSPRGRRKGKKSFTMFSTYKPYPTPNQNSNKNDTVFSPKNFKEDLTFTSKGNASISFGA